MSHIHPADLQGLSQLAIDGVLGTTSLVEEMHYAIGRVSGPSLPSKEGRTRGITGLVYRSVRGVTGLVGATTHLAFRQILPRLPRPDSTPERDRVLAALNGVLGDHLEATANPLALSMTLRFQGQALAPDHDRLSAVLPPSNGRLAVFLHGLCMSDQHWSADTEASNKTDLTRAVHEEAGYLPLRLSYNTGRPIQANGREFAERLEALLQAWPEPVDEIVLIGHSMGGLVARSACHHAQRVGHTWIGHTRRLITLGSPHHGAPLERIGHLVDRALALTPFSRPFTRLGAIRSAGITDLRFGNLVGAEGGQPGDSTSKADRDRPPRVPPKLRVCALAACLGPTPHDKRSRLLGDGLVPVDSALGRHPDPQRHLALPTADQELLCVVGHLDLPTHPDAVAAVLRWLAR
ncbi:MAG: lipase family alpha/beta hydrolase [Wenzhouxiangella sp.]